MFPDDGACAGSCVSGSEKVQEGVFLNSGPQASVQVCQQPVAQTSWPERSMFGHWWGLGLTANVGMWGFLPVSFLWSTADK